MRSLSDKLRSVNRQRTSSRIVAADDHEPLITPDVLRQLGVLLLVVFAFAMIALVLLNAPR